MKRRFLSMATVLILALALMMPAQAAMEYGRIYDETEILYSDELDTLGNEILPAFVEKYDIGLQVDILTSIGEFSSVQESAEYLYTEYGYGGSSGNGASLTLMVSQDADGVVLEDWYAHFGGDSMEWTTNAPWNIQEVYDIMVEENWEGDLDQDIQTLTEAVTAMVDGLESFVLAGGVADTIWSPVENGETPPAQSGGTQQEPQLDNITDAAALLTNEEWQALERQARSISEQYGVGVYVITVENYRDYADGSIYDAADALYHGYSLGLGENRDGIMLLLSMEDRDYNLIAYGDYAKYAFNEDGREYLVDFFLDDLGNDEWYNGFADYLTWSADYLENAKNETPYSYDHVPVSDSARTTGILIRVAAIFLVPLIVAGIYTLILSSKMKSVEMAVEAVSYISSDLDLTFSSDIYTHTTEDRRRIERDDDNKSSGSSSGGGSGTSGKF